MKSLSSAERSLLRLITGKLFASLLLIINFKLCSAYYTSHCSIRKGREGKIYFVILINPLIVLVSLQDFDIVIIAMLKQTKKIN